MHWIYFFAAVLSLAVVIFILAFFRDYIKIRRELHKMRTHPTEEQEILSGNYGHTPFTRNLIQDLDWIREEYRKLHKKHQIQSVDWRLLMSSMSEGVVALHRDGRVLYYNRSIEKMIFHQKFPEDRYPRLEELLLNADLFSFFKEASQTDQRIVKKIHVQSSSEKYYWVRSDPIRNSREEVIGSMILLTDISQEEFAERHRQEFAGNASHQLRSPLTLILGHLENVLDDPEMVDGSIKRSLTIAHKQCEKLNQIVDQLLYLTRLANRTKSIALKEQDVLPVIQDSVEACLEAAHEKAIKIHLDPTPVPKIPLNGALMGQALVNIIDNAIKYSPRQSQIQVSLQKKEATQALIRIEDNGPGIRREEHEKIFQRFYQSRPENSLQGSSGVGLGLAIAKHIVHGHGGQISVQSEQGHGSIFEISLPMDSKE